LEIRKAGETGFFSWSGRLKQSTGSKQIPATKTTGFQSKKIEETNLPQHCKFKKHCLKNKSKRFYSLSANFFSCHTSASSAPRFSPTALPS
jgi:hypothetical protein